jgi:pimeloyl-ACP methyl ester carboxylesterase
MTRRDFLLTSAGAAGAALLECASGHSQTEATNMQTEGAKRIDVPAFHASRRFAKTHFGRIAYIERSAGPVALFMHGLPLNGYQWRGALERLSSQRRCIAPDFMGLGYTEWLRTRSWPLQRRRNRNQAAVHYGESRCIMLSRPENRVALALGRHHIEAKRIT